MSRTVPYLAEKHIEREAGAVLAEFEEARGLKLEPPIPIDDIVEKLLKLNIDFDDMHNRYNVPRSSNGQTDILGAIYGDGSIFIDESLDPDANPARQNRYRFTLAHEAGHWLLHRQLIMEEPAQPSLLDQDCEPKFICRLSQAKEPVEWQADYFAASLLMPRDMVFAFWKQCFPDDRPRVLNPPEGMSDAFVAIPRRYTQIEGRYVLETDDEALERVSKPLAERFQVSPIAMRIRLEGLELLHRDSPRHWLLSDQLPF